MSYFAAYIATILATNIGFAHIHPIDLGWTLFSPMAFAAGAVFVVRDFAQRAVGHWVLASMAIGCLLSYMMADPFVALASAASFAISELADWALYSFSRMAFHRRVLWSSVLSTPIDSFVFLWVIELHTFSTFAIMVACKLCTAIGIYLYAECKQTRNGRTTQAASVPRVR